MVKSNYCGSPFTIKKNNGETSYFNDESKGIVVWHVKQESDGISYLLMPEKINKQLELTSINTRKPVLILEIGLIYGRDAVSLNNIQMVNNNVIITGELNGELCEAINTDKDILFNLEFVNVIHFEKTELDFYEDFGEYSSSFEEYLHSAKIKKFKETKNTKLKENHRHFVFYTYDFVFEFIATDYKMKIENKV